MSTLHKRTETSAIELPSICNGINVERCKMVLLLLASLFFETRSDLHRIDRVVTVHDYAIYDCSFWLWTVFEESWSPHSIAQPPDNYKSMKRHSFRGNLCFKL